MIRFEVQKVNSLNPNIDINVNAATLYTICKEGIKGFPAIDYKFDPEFEKVLGFDSAVDELSVDIYMSGIISKIIEYAKSQNGSSIQIDFDSVPLIVIYQLSLLYGLTSFDSLFTTIYEGTKFVPECLWKKGEKQKITLEEFSKCFGQVDLCYNVNTATSFTSFFKGDLNSLTDELKKTEISISPAQNSLNISEGEESRSFEGKLTIPASFVREKSKFEEKTLWKTTIDSKEMEDTNGLQKTQFQTTDGLTMNSLTISDPKVESTQYYSMFKETELKKFIDNYFQSYGITPKSYGNYPYGKYIYANPGDSKIIKQNQKTLLSEPEGLFLQDGKKIGDWSGGASCGWRKGNDSVWNGIFGKRFKHVQISGWQFVDGQNHSGEISDSDVETLKNNDIVITYRYQTRSEKYRQGNIFNPSDRVFENDRECFVGSWDGTGEKIYLQNQYSYGDKVKLENNPRTACVFKVDEKIRIFTGKSKELIKKLGKVCLYSFINDCLEMISQSKNEWNLAYNLNKYAVECANTKIFGTFSESPFISFLYVRHREKSFRKSQEESSEQSKDEESNETPKENVEEISYEEMIKRFGDQFKLEVSNKPTGQPILLELFLPKLEIKGSQIRFSTTSYSDFNKFFIYGNSDKWKIRSIPINVNEEQTIDNMFLIHNEIFNKPVPEIFSNFNLFS